MQILQPICVINCVIKHSSWHTSWLRLHGFMSSGANASSLCAWHGELHTVHVCFEKSVTLITCNLNPEAHLRNRNAGLSSTPKASQIRTCVDLRQPQVETVSGRNKKKENPQERFTLGSHLPYLRHKVWPMAAVTDCLSQFPDYNEAAGSSHVSIPSRMTTKLKRGNLCHTRETKSYIILSNG